ncbi:MAG TPA: hypothetical protein PKY77_13860 [Phycisphaerae bacterium]|nr:hypothetical protein [Phycisphaerae bacterium]HRY70477.1 hypothetical protein [Phycisphaerae bacterium]HSA28206.1 hypothetical protein [Phycisphaerae bacterium]
MSTRLSAGGQSGKGPGVRRVSKGFPLWRHPSGRWCKKIRQRVHYFGSTAKDPTGQGALDEWLRVKDDLLAGREPRPVREGLTLRELVNRFLSFKQGRVQTGEIRQSTWRENYRVCETMIRHFGSRRAVADLQPQDFGAFRLVLARGVGPAELGKRIGTVKSVFTFGFDEALIETPVRLGRDFRRPSAKSIRLERNTKPRTLPTATQMRRLIDEAGVHLRAMILLACNCGIGQSDLASLPRWAIDLENGWLDSARRKTGCPRRAKLWAETVEALRLSFAKRPEPTGEADGDLCFITKYGRRFVRFQPSKTGHGGTWVDSVNLEFKKLLKETGVEVGGGFYRIRHLYRTVADGARDQRAIDLTMGHTPTANDMSAHYVESIDDSRLEAVAAHVHFWLYGI